MVEYTPTLTGFLVFHKETSDHGRLLPSLKDALAYTCSHDYVVELKDSKIIACWDWDGKPGKVFANGTIELS